MSTTDQYLALPPKRVPDTGPIEGWIYHLPYGAIAAQPCEDGDHWHVVEYDWTRGASYVEREPLGESEARMLAHGVRLLRLAELDMADPQAASGSP